MSRGHAQHFRRKMEECQLEVENSLEFWRCGMSLKPAVSIVNRFKKSKTW